MSSVTIVKETLQLTPISPKRHHAYTFFLEETVCLTETKGYDEVTISVKNPENGHWEDRNFTREQLGFLKQILTQF